jgi:hypothetical protein
LRIDVAIFQFEEKKHSQKLGQVVPQV